MTSLFWQSYEGGKYHLDTVVGGFDRGSRKKLYLARAVVDGEVIPGKLHESHSTAYVPLNGKEVAVKRYEVLVNPQDVYLEWIAPQGDTIPTGAVVGSTSGQGKNIFIARAKFNGDYVPGKLIASDGQDYCFIPWGGEEHKFTEYEVMCINTITPQSRVQ